MGTFPRSDVTHLAYIAALPYALAAAGHTGLSHLLVFHLAEALPRLSPLPAQILLYGRLLEAWHDQLSDLEALLSDMDYEPSQRFDPNIAREFRLGPDDD